MTAEVAKRSRALACSLALVPVLARAADQTVLGSSLVVRNPSTPDKRTVVVKAKELASDDTIVGDPVVNGATLTVTLRGGTPTSGTFILPSGMSLITRKPFWSVDPTKGFRYSDSKGENGPVKKLQLKSARGVFQIKGTVSGKLGPLVVLPPNPGTGGCARLSLVGGDDYDVAFDTGQIVDGGTSYFRVARPSEEASCAPPPAACASDAVIVDETPSPLYALEGSLVSTQRYVQGSPSAPSWTPTKVRMRVQSSEGQPIAGCEVRFTPLTRGWFFADAATTDGSGMVSGWWVAGREPLAQLEARVARAGANDSTVIAQATVTGPHPNAVPAPYLSFSTGPFDSYAIDATPLTDPNFTYYATLLWSGSYAGLQRFDELGGHLAIWSLWDVNGISAEIVDAPASSKCRRFDGSEGTGIQCLFSYAWQAGRPYRFQLYVAHAVADRTDYTLTITDLATEATTIVGTLRYGAWVWPADPGTFIEQFAGDQQSCLDGEQRAVLWDRVRARVPGTPSFRDIATATFWRPYDPAYGHGSLCFNYDHGVFGDAFFTSAGGTRVGRPCGPEVGEGCPPLQLP